MSLVGLKSASIVPGSNPPSRYSLEEWHLSNRTSVRCCLTQQTIADQVLAECGRVKDLTEEVVRTNKQETNHKIEEKIKDIDFLRGEIRRQRKEVVLELDNLTTFYERIYDALNNIKAGPEMVNNKCLMLREARIGIDLCRDDVERELLKEHHIIEQVVALLTRTAEQAQEQIRRLRSTTYLMDRDLEAKENAKKIDEHNLSLRETSMNLSMYHGYSQLDCSNITKEEWDVFTEKSIEDASKEINSARQLRSYVDTILNQASKDLLAQYNLVQAAFVRRISETKDVKTKLEIQHAEIVRQSNEMVMNITELEKSISNKEGFMALAHTRLGNRAQRGGAELCRDLVETQLVDEARQIRINTSILQQTLAEAQATLRYLLKTQIQLETDINIKNNTLQIDEVDCMSMRETMDYHFY
ncbi:tektin-1-like [Coccinella septempunctata]|uniref:tektin-1-like n=1 Tax=Coccinella septempunctata TaxID=41139 RepID=UPI001D098C68|nr:tektin-1-like [Coccinella septempunctata]